MAKTNRVLEATERPNSNRLDSTGLDSNGVNATARNEQIAQRAYQYWENRGREDGYDLEDWLKAEQELSPPPVGQMSAK